MDTEEARDFRVALAMIAEDGAISRFPKAVKDRMVGLAKMGLVVIGYDTVYLTRAGHVAMPGSTHGVVA